MTPMFDGRKSSDIRKADYSVPKNAFCWHLWQHPGRFRAEGIQCPGRSNTLPSGKAELSPRHCITQQGGHNTSHAGARRIATAPANKQACNSCSTGVGGRHTQAAGRKDEPAEKRQGKRAGATHSSFHTGPKPPRKRQPPHKREAATKRKPI